MLTVRTMLIVVAVAACGVCALIFWPATPTSAPRISVATPAPELRQAAPTVVIKPSMVRVHSPAAKARLKLPAAVSADAGQHVLAASQVRADERPHTLITLLDERTGEATTFDRADPLPWLAPETRGELGISYGIRDGMPVGRLSLRQNLLQLKSVRLGATATLDQDGQWFAGVGAFYRW